MLCIIHIDNVTRVLALSSTLPMPSDLLASLPNLLIVEADPQPGWLVYLTLQVEEIFEERVVENTHLTTDTSKQGLTDY